MWTRCFSPFVCARIKDGGNWYFFSRSFMSHWWDLPDSTYCFMIHCLGNLHCKNAGLALESWRSIPYYLVCQLQKFRQNMRNSETLSMFPCRHRYQLHSYSLHNPLSAEILKLISWHPGLKQLRVLGCCFSYHGSEVLFLDTTVV